MINEKEKGDTFLEKVQSKGLKQIIDVNINTLKKKQKVSLLDEILHSGENGASVEEKPIIVVPPTIEQSKICYSNAIEFFTNGNYIDGEEARQNEGEEEFVMNKTFEYEINGKNIEFEVYDSILNFTKYHWRRVVAYFAQAEDWEFKGFPPKESIVDIFLKIRGYFFTFSDLAVPDSISKLNVKVLKVRRTQRYEDQSVKKEFWDDLIDFLNKERYKGR